MTENETARQDGCGNEQGTHEDYRSGAKLAGELAEEFGHIETVDSPDGGDTFSVRNVSHTGATFNTVTERAAELGFRVRAVMDDGRTIAFGRIDGHHTDPRNEEGGS